MIIHIIPSRLDAQRLPRKPLADIGGKPMIIRVWEQAVQSNSGRVVVAAAEQEVVDLVESAGGEAVLTPPDLPSGSDRVYHALQTLDPEGRYTRVTNIQGDMPFLDPASVKSAVEALEQRPEFDMMTLAALIQDEFEKHTPQVVKVAITPHTDRIGQALYFSRSCIPSGEQGPFLHHIGLYVYRREALARFVSLPQTHLEKNERLEQLRGLENGLRIGVCLVPEAPLSVDTPQDLERARALCA